MKCIHGSLNKGEQVTYLSLSLSLSAKAELIPPPRGGFHRRRIGNAFRISRPKVDILLQPPLLLQPNLLLGKTFSQDKREERLHVSPFPSRSRFAGEILTCSDSHVSGSVKAGKYTLPDFTSPSSERRERGSNSTSCLREESPSPPLPPRVIRFVSFPVAAEIFHACRDLFHVWN